MGISHSPQELANKFSGLAADLEKQNPVALDKAALAAKIAFLAAPGAPKGRMSGVGTRGAKVGVRYRIYGNTAIVRWFGPAHLANYPTKPHDIKPRKRRGKQAIVINGQAVARAHTRGTKGKHFFELGREIAKREAPKIFNREMRSTIANHFK